MLKPISGHSGAQSARRLLPGSVRGRLFLLVAANTITALILGLVLVHTAEGDHRRMISEQLSVTSRALAAAVDFQLNHHATLLQKLATFPSLQNEDFQAFDADARRIAQGHQVWILLADRSGQQLINTRVGPKVPLPRFPVEGDFQKAMEQGQTHISDLTISVLTKRPVLYISTPVHDGRYFLTIAMEPSVLAEALAVTQIAPDGTIAVIDRKGTIAVRNRAAERYVGSRATEDIVQIISTGTNGFLESVTKDGIPVVTAFLRCQAGWTVLVAIPKDEIFASARNLLTRALLLSALLVGIAAFLAAPIGQAVVQGVNALVLNSERLASGIPLSAQPTGLVEMDKAAEAMRRAAIQLQTRDEERKRAEDELRSSEERLRLITDNIPPLIGYIDSSLKFRFANRAFQEYTGGHSRQEIMGKSIHEVLGRKDDRQFQYQVEAAQGGERISFEDKLQHPQLGARATEFCFIPHLEENGQVLGIYIFVHDIHERKQAEERLLLAKETSERSRAQLEAIVNSMAEGVVIFDRSGHLLDMNPAALRIHGFDSVESLQCQLADLSNVFELRDLAGNILPLDRWPIARSLRGESFTAYEVRVARTDGSKQWIASYSGAPVRDSAGNVVLAIITLRDVTEQREAEEEARRAREELAMANAELEKRVEERTRRLRETIGDLEAFSYSIAHDMRAPLRAMRSFSEILMTDFAPQLPPDAQDYLRRIHSSAGRLDSLLIDVLNVSRLSQAEMPLKPVDVGENLRAILESYPEFQEHRSNIHIDSKLPLVHGNEAAVIQCFANLLGNAIKFTAPGKAPVIRIWSEGAGDFIRVRVQDNGIGIPPEGRERIFRIFEQLNPERPGTGVGLAIVKRAVERMGGRIGVESTPGIGSVFWIELKRVSSNEHDPSNNHEPQLRFEVQGDPDQKRA